ncbi:MAG: hypothetical protein HY549_10180 [Elusimicrobia bacterium]|nr:hypothetical protein [Elusimicrobiota bacterium]
MARTLITLLFIAGGFGSAHVANEDWARMPDLKFSRENSAPPAVPAAAQPRVQKSVISTPHPIVAVLKRAEEMLGSRQWIFPDHPFAQA